MADNHRLFGERTKDTVCRLYAPKNYIYSIKGLFNRDINYFKSLFVSGMPIDESFIGYKEKFQWRKFYIRNAFNAFTPWSMSGV